MPGMGIGFLSYEVIWQKAEEFLSRYNPRRKIPVPIEEIVEFDFGISIRTIPNLASIIEVEGFTSNDLKCMYIDESLFLRVPTRYRFTLAHEMGHIILHRRIFERVNIHSIDSWMDFYDNLGTERNSWELQAYNFAGLILVPRADLKRRVQEVLNRPMPSLRSAKSQNITRLRYLPYVVEEIATRLAPLYDVSVQTMTKRINFDKLSRLIP